MCGIPAEVEIIFDRINKIFRIRFILSILLILSILSKSVAAYFEKLRLIQNLHAQFLRLGELGTGFGSGQHEIRFLAHAAGHFAAERFNLIEKPFPVFLGNDDEATA